MMGGLAMLLLLRLLLKSKQAKSESRRAFLREYVTVLNDPKYKVKSNYEQVNP